MEAANFAKRYDQQCRQLYDRKAAKTSKIVATKALACKLAKAAWHVMSEQTDYDPSADVSHSPARHHQWPRGFGFIASKPIPQASMPGRREIPVPACGFRAEGGARVASQQSPILRFGKTK